MGRRAEAARLSGAGRESLHAVGHRVVAVTRRAGDRLGDRHREARHPRRRDRGARNTCRQAAPLSGSRALKRVLCAGAPGGDLDVPGEGSLVDGTFSQLVMLGSSGMLLTALIVLWRKGVPAYITAYRWPASLLAARTSTVGDYGGDRALDGAA